MSEILGGGACVRFSSRYNYVVKVTTTSPPPGAISTVVIAEHTALLTELARRYIWWLTPEEAMELPSRVVAQVMNIGDFEDVRRMQEALGDDCLREVLQHAEAGQFDERSWHYWHYVLGLAKAGEVPPLPVRRLD